MPGIVGLVTSVPRRRAERELARMIATLRHEPFYTTGSLIDESLGLYVGWVAREGSFSDGMPLRTESGEVALVFSGEEFPDPDTVRGLKSRGHSLDGDREYLVHLYEASPEFPACLNGRFHGLLVDRSRGSATLFNDRYGMHRLYYHEGKDAFYFGAEAKAILAVRPELRQLDPRGLGEFVACGCVLEDRSLFRDVHVLPAGSAWTFRRGGAVARKRYFLPREWEDQGILDADEYHHTLRDTFSGNLGRYFRSHERVAMSLTGGLDTRMVMAWHRGGPGSLPCYTFGGMVRDSRDVAIARDIARVCEQPHEVIRVGRDFIERFDRYAERTVYLTDGCADVSRSADLYVNERARTIAPVRMTGNYGGEVLRRVRAFKPIQPMAGLYTPEVMSSASEARETYARMIQGHPLSFAAFDQAPWHHYGLLALEETQLSLRSPYLDNDFVRTVYRAPAPSLASNGTSLRLIAEGNAALGRIATDRARRVDEALFKLEYAYDYGMPHWAARVDRAFSFLRFDRLLLGRHKFYHYRLWYRDALAKYVRAMLLDRRTLTRPYLDGRAMERVVEGHLEGRRNHTIEIHKLLTLELLHRALLDGAAGASLPVAV
jgi:asparagine synthase (glutamine-hydrolysing)